MDETIVAPGVDTGVSEDEPRALLMPEPSHPGVLPETHFDATWEAGTQVLGVLAVVAAAAYVATSLLKQGLYRLDWLEAPWTKYVLRYFPWLVGAVVARWWWQVDFLGVVVLDREIQVPVLLLGALAGRSSDVGYVWARERLPWLDWLTLTSEGPHRTSALLRTMVQETEVRRAERRAPTEH